MTATVSKQPDGTWAVLVDGVIRESGIASNERAWRIADRLSNEDRSPSESRAEFGFGKRATPTPSQSAG